MRHKSVLLASLLTIYLLGLWLLPGPAVRTVHAQGTPNCSQALSFTSATPGTAINTISGAQAGCAGWRLTWSVTGFTAATIQLEGSQDNSSWSAFGSTLVQEGSNPTSWTSGTASNTIVVRASQPYVRVNITGVTGSGTIKTLILGYSGTSAQNDTGGGGSGGCSALGGDLSGTCTSATVLQAQGGEVTFSNTGNVVAKGSYTSGSGAGTTGALDLTGATSGQLVTLTVGDSTAAGTMKLAGNTGNVVYNTSAGTSGHCVQYGTDGIAITDAGSACGSGSGGAGAVGYSSSNALLSGTTYFLAPSGGLAANTTEANVQGIANTTSTLQNFAVKVSAAPGTGNSLTFTFRDAGSSTGVTCTISNAATSCSDVTHTAAITAGDLIDVQMVDTGVTATVSAVILYNYGSVVGVGPSAQAHNSASQSVSGTTTVTFNTNDWDTCPSCTIHSTVTNPTRFTAPSNGYYMFLCSLQLNTGATAGLLAQQNGVLIDFPSMSVTESGGPVMTFNWTFHANAGDYFECVVGPGAATSINAGSAYMQLTKLSSTF